MKRVARYAGRIAASAVAAIGVLLLASQPLFGAPQDPLDAQLRGRLAQLGFTGDVESTLKTRLGRPVEPRPREYRPAAVVRHRHRSARRQHLRRLPLADTRLRRQPADRDRDRQQRDRGAGPRRAEEHAPRADGPKHRVLPGADVERALQLTLGRPIRQPCRVLDSRRPRARASPTSRTCSSPRRSSRRPSAPRWQASRSPEITMRSGRRSPGA